MQLLQHKGPGVYQIVHTASRCAYIGASASVRSRLKAHLKSLNDGTHANVFLQRAWRQFGSSAFTCDLLLPCKESMLLWHEQLFIDACWSHNVPLYNLRINVFPKHRTNARSVVVKLRRAFDLQHAK